MKLHLGCGRHHVEGFTNVDVMPGPTVDVVANFDLCPDLTGDMPWLWTPSSQWARLPFDDNSVTESFGQHVLEHLRRPLEFMQELWRVTEHGGVVEFAVPFGSSDDAWEDPTHVRPYFLGSFGYFSQPFYWRADYGYRADWQPVKIVLDLDTKLWENADPDAVVAAVLTERNVVQQMTAELVCVKPIRPSEAGLQTPPVLEYRLV